MVDLLLEGTRELTEARQFSCGIATWVASFVKRCVQPFPHRATIAPELLWPTVVKAWRRPTRDRKSPLGRASGRSTACRSFVKYFHELRHSCLLEFLGDKEISHFLLAHTFVFLRPHECGRLEYRRGLVADGRMGGGPLVYLRSHRSQGNSSKPSEARKPETNMSERTGSQLFYVLFYYFLLLVYF